MASDRKLALAKRMRRDPSEIEAKLWKLLRARRLEGLKFRRQVPIGPYVVDFLCLRYRLVVEADGPFHVAAYDAERDAWLERQGFRVLRFDNGVISAKAEHVLVAIERAALGKPRGPFDGL